MALNTESPAMNNDQFDLFPDARQARDRGIAQVISHNEDWHNAALRIIRGLQGWQGIAEDLHQRIEAQIGPPKHSNNWGALINAAVVRCLLIATGEYRQPRCVNSHARKTQVFRSSL